MVQVNVPDDDEQYEPVEPRSTRLHKSAVMGDYYRDLSANYDFYQATGRWPTPPYPPARHALDDLKYDPTARIPQL